MGKKILNEVQKEVEEVRSIEEKFEFSASKMRDYFFEYMEPFVNEFVEKHIVPAAKSGNTQVKVYMDKRVPSEEDYKFRKNIEIVLRSSRYGFSILTTIDYKHEENGYKYTVISW